MKLHTKTRMTQTVKTKRELRQKVSNRIVQQVKSKMYGYGNGRHLSETTGIPLPALRAIAKDGIATPSLIEKVKKYFNIN